jgi:hypothetical protein
MARTKMASVPIAQPATRDPRARQPYLRLQSRRYGMYCEGH